MKSGKQEGRKFRSLLLIFMSSFFHVFLLKNDDFRTRHDLIFKFRKI